MSATKKILVVEDTASHMTDAVQHLESQGVEVIKATTANKATEIIMIADRDRKAGKDPGLDGVITDLYLPHAAIPGYDHAQYPCGLGVALVAKGKDFPVVICTAGAHHGKRYEWIHSALWNSKMFSMIDVFGRDMEAEAEHKNWEEALKVLLAKIEQSSPTK